MNNFKKKLATTVTLLTVLLTPTLANAETKYVEPTIGLNYRVGNSTNTKKIGALPYGSSVEVLYSLGTYRITHYCGCASCNGSWTGSPTASGAYPVSGRTVAMADLPFGTKVEINGQIYTVEDRGVPSGCVDIYVDSHSEALNSGMYYAEVRVVG